MKKNIRILSNIFDYIVIFCSIVLLFVNFIELFKGDIKSIFNIILSCLTLVIFLKRAVKY